MLAPRVTWGVGPRPRAQPPTRSLLRCRGACGVLLAVLACGESNAPGVPILAVEPASVDLEHQRTTTVAIRNDGTEPIGPIELVVTLRDSAGKAALGPRVTIAPSEIATLNPGASRPVALGVETPAGTSAGLYHGEFVATLTSGAVLGAVTLTFRVGCSATLPAGARAHAGTAVHITEGPDRVRQGDVASYSAAVLSAEGSISTAVCWSIVPADAGMITGDGRFVAYQAGTARLVARLGDAADSLTLQIAARGLVGSFTTVGRGQLTTRFTSDLWVHGPAAYTGTWGARTVNRVMRPGNTLYAWDVTRPAAPVLTDSVILDARVVNDIKVHRNGTLAIVTHEGSNDGRNGVTLLDLGIPHHPRVITRFTASLETGVHNAWVDGDHVYLVVDGVSPSSGLRILDVSDRETPRVVGAYYAGSSFLHDVYVRDGLAFLSHWNAGLVILDVGAGIAGGSPAGPVEVSRIAVEGGQTHNAWYWPENGYVFVGEEDFRTPGIMHVVDVRDLRTPREVATFRVPGSTPHNLWLDEARAVLYLSWYTKGLRALDVSGELLGELDRQGREIAGWAYAGAGDGCGVQDAATTCTWAPQLQDGHTYLADLNTGLWILRPLF